MQEQPIAVPDRMVTLQGLRMLCLQKHREAPLEMWTTAELVAAIAVFKRHTHRYMLEMNKTEEWKEFFRLKKDTPGWRENPGYVIFTRDIEELPKECEIPKWIALATWLTPESVAGSAPDFISELAQLALSERLVSAA